MIGTSAAPTPDDEAVRAAFRAADEASPMRDKSRWQIWRDAVSWALAGTAAARPVAWRFPKAGINNGYHYVESLNGEEERFKHHWEPVFAAASAAVAVEPVDDSERAELERLRALVHSPHTDKWMEAVNLEAAHQQERWGSEHDAGKITEDWIFLAGHLMGKASVAFKVGDHAKGLHHIISSSAVLLNWHRNVTGINTGMRPGIQSRSSEPAADDASIETTEAEAREVKP